MIDNIAILIKAHAVQWLAQIPLCQTTLYINSFILIHLERIDPPKRLLKGAGIIGDKILATIRLGRTTPRTPCIPSPITAESDIKDLKR